MANDFLVGGGGNDRLDGGKAEDSFIDGLGNDTFVFKGEAGNDTIFDFVSGTDKINLSSCDNGLADVVISADGVDKFIDIDTDGNSTADFTIQLLNTKAPVESDFIFQRWRDDINKPGGD